MASTIRIGSTGADVAAWQRVVGQSPDGVFGVDTYNATRAWQAAHGLSPVDGIVGKDTWAAAGVATPGAAALGRVEKVPYGSRLVDSLGFSMGGTAAQALALRRDGADGVFVYSDVASREVCESVIAAGLGLAVVTRAGEYSDGSEDEQAWMRKVGYPAGASVALDFEGMPAYDAGKKDPAALGNLLRKWAADVDAAGWSPCLYLGAPQPLTSAELDSLHMAGFWLGIGKPVDRNGAIAYPGSGFCMRQLWHNQKNGIAWRSTGVLVDADFADCDHYGRTMSWVVAG